jgi:hypothetical protein
MADIVGSLFGVTPELYQEQRDQMARQRAMQLAQLDPLQQASYGAARAGQQLGGAFASAMGVEDPQMRLISQRNALARQIDMTDPDSIMRGAQMAAQMGDTTTASALAEYARKAASEMALTQQRLRERQGVDPIQQLIRAGKHTPQSISLYAKSGDIKDLELIEKPEKGPTPTEIEKLQLYRERLIDGNAPASKIAEVDAIIKGASSPRGTVVQNIMPEFPGDKKFADIPAFRLSVQKTVEPMSKEQIESIPELKGIIDFLKWRNLEDPVWQVLGGSPVDYLKLEESINVKKLSLTDAASDEVVNHLKNHRQSVLSDALNKNVCNSSLNTQKIIKIFRERNVIMMPKAPAISRPIMIAAIEITWLW